MSEYAATVFGPMSSPIRSPIAGSVHTQRLRWRARFELGRDNVIHRQQ